MSKKITLENVDSSELPEVPVIGEVKQIRFTQDMELVSTLADSDLFMIQAGADLEARPNTITFDLIIKNLSGPIEEGSKKFVTGDMMFKVIGDMNLLDTWDNTNLVSSLNATYVNVRRIEEELRREINRSTGKDEQHDEQIANLRQDLTSTNEMLNQEINRSVAKDNEHDELLEGLRDDVDSTSSKLDAEIDRSTTKDAEHDTLLKGLRVDVNANKSAIDSEVARSTARDEAHDAAISKNASDITTESSRAKAEEAKIRQEMQAADTNLQNAITAETERATGVEEDLQRQITDLSGSTDDRLEALEALSHEQNTDTGTTSKTFVIDSGNTGAMLKAEGGGLSTRTKGDAGYANFTVQNLVIKGDVTQEGDTFITQAERVEVRDNMILINEGETGAGVTAGFAGIEVDRGTEQNFMFGFNESDGMFKIGKEGNMFDVALRQPVGDMTDGMFASWDAATKTFKTTNLIPPTLKLYLGTNNVDISYNESDSGSIRLRTNGQSLNIFTKNGYTNFRSTLNKFQFIGDVSIYTGKLYTSADTFNIRVAGGSRMVIDGTGSTLSTPLTATSFFRSSDNAEVLYAVNPSTLTDGMFLSWDATNKMVVTTNIVPKGQSVFFGNENSFITYGSTSLNSGSGSAIGFNLNMQFGNLLIYPSSVSGCLVFDGGLRGQGYGNGIKFNSPINVEKVNSTGKFLELSVGDTTSIKMEGSGVTIATQVVSPSYHRSSDDSEVLYQADLKSVLTGKETNYAPSVKAVSDAIDAVNTGTTESLKNYLKLSGGTMTGPIIMNNSIVLKSKDNNGVERRLIGKSIEGTTHIGDIDGEAQIYTSDTDVIHFRSTGSYKILDSYNLPDPATKSGNNAFTGTNSFVANKFSVGNFKVNTNSNLEVNIPYKEDATKLWRSLYFMYNSLEDTKVTFGSMISATAADYAYIGIGSVSYNNAQYKFRTESLDLNTIFRIDCGEATVISANESTIIFGSNKRGCYVRSNDTDLAHIKNNNSYKIWDASNLPDPATKSGNNAFTGTNSFVANKFSVGNFKVNTNSNLEVNIPYKEDATKLWRSLYFMYNSLEDTKVTFGSMISATAADYAYIGIGSVSYNNAQYKFRTESLDLNTIFRIDCGEATVISANESTIIFGSNKRGCYVRSNDTDLAHIKNNNSYKIWDASNLPTPASTSDIPDVSDMAKKSEANTFTAQNTFIAGRFNVGPFQVTSTGSLSIDMANTGPWERKVVWRNNSAATSNVMFGSYGNVDNANYAWIGVGDVEHSTAQYIFYPEKMRVPIAWSLEDASGNALVWSQSANLVNLGRAIGTTKICSGAVDLIHTKGSTDYKILDESNYSQYLPTTSKWTYGFVHESKEVYDLNTDLVGPDKGKLAYNYTGPSYWTNGPTGMDYGTVIQIWGSGSPASTPSLMPQLAFDVNHNVANSTRYMYFRTANNLGYGDSSNWKRVVTADEKPAGYVLDENSYPALRYIESSTTLTWLRSPQSGFLPFTAINIVNGGYGNIGTSTWTFQSAYIANVYANKFITSGGSSSQFLKGDGSLDSTAYYPNVGRGFLSFDADGRPVMAYNQGYAAKFSDGITREILWTNGTNAVTLGNTTNNAIIQIAGTSMVNRASGETYATQEWTTGKLAKYLPLTGGTITGQLIVNYGGSTPLIINNTNTSSSVTYISIRLKGANKTHIGCSDSYGPFLQDANTNRCIMVKSDGAYFGTELSAGSKLLTSSDLSGYATQTWANSQFAPLSIFKTLVGYPAIVNTTNEYILTSSGNITNVNYRTPSGTVIPTSWYWRNGTSTGYAAGYWGNLYMAEKLVATQEWVSGRGYLTSITKSMVTSALGYTPPTTNTTYSQATSSTLGLVKIGATGLAAKNYAVQLNSSGQMYVSVPWTDTDTTYSAATSSTYGLVKIGATGLSEKQYAVKLNSSGQMYVSVPWTDTDTNTHYTTRLYAGASGSATNVAISNPYLKVTDDNTYRNQVRFIGSGATSISSDDSGNITITSTNTTYGLASSSSNGLMSSSQYTKLSNCIETVSATNMVTSVQVVDTIPGESSQVTGRLYLKFA